MKISPDRIKQIIKEELAHAHTGDQEERRIRRHLERIDGLVQELGPAFQDGDDKDAVPEWIQEKVAVIAAMLQTILDYKNGEKIR